MPQFWQGRNTSIVLPTPTALLLRDRIRERWGPRAEEISGSSRRTTVYVWFDHPGTHGTYSTPMGRIVIQWGTPTPAASIISQIQWDPNVGGTQEDVCRIINQVVGWPVARAA